MTTVDFEKGDLSQFQQAADLLIPSRLHQMAKDPAQITVVPLEVVLGRLDDLYQPSLAILIAERDALEKPSKQQEKDDPVRDDLYNWGRVLNSYRQQAIRRGLLGETDQAQLLLIAQHLHPFGIKVETYIQAATYRRQGLGRAFFDNFERRLGQMGYKYYWGTNHAENIDFFRKIGNRPFSQLRTSNLSLCGVRIPYYYLNMGLATIKFLDELLEQACVQPEFLKVE